MDALDNPYAPGAGSPPPELAGRDDAIRLAETAMHRARAGRFAKGIVFHGLRGVGKTVLLNAIRKRAENAGYAVINFEVPEERSFLSALLPATRRTLIRLSTKEALRDKFIRSRKLLNGLISSVKVTYQDVEVALDPEAGSEPLTGDLEIDLGEVLAELGRAAQANGTCVALFVDEIQYISHEHLSVLLAAIHHVTQEELPVVIFAAGLPQILSLSGKAKTYAERLLLFHEIGQLSSEHAREALVEPAMAQGVDYEQPAVDRILRETIGYPYFIQEWGQHAWNIAESSPIRDKDAQAATAIALSQLDESFFKVRFDQLTPAEKRYMRAMAELGPGLHRSGDIAGVMGRRVESVAPTRNSLIKKGMIYSPAHGDTAFTVPLFDGFMKRIMPEMPK